MIFGLPENSRPSTPSDDHRCHGSESQRYWSSAQATDVARPGSTTLGSTTGIISGTPSVIANNTGIVIRATDGSGDTADTNAFAIDIQA